MVTVSQEKYHIEIHVTDLSFQCYYSVLHTSLLLMYNLDNCIVSIADSEALSI